MAAFRKLLGGVAAAALAGSVYAAPIVPPSIAAGFTNAAPASSRIGTNLAPVTDFTREYPFANFFRQARPWFPTNQIPDPVTGFPPDGAQFNCAAPNPDLPSCDQTTSTLSRDSNGNILSLAQGQGARTVIFAGAPHDPGLKGKRFTILYDGEGNLAYNNVQVISQTPGRDVIRLQSPSSRSVELIAIITLTETNPSNPLRNIRMVLDGGICASNPLAQVPGAAACPNGDFVSFASRTGANRIVFNPGFLSTIKDYHSIRFMDWMRTNNSSQSGFGSRPLPSNQFWNTEDDFGTFANEAKGVPLEVMIALANLMDQDPWFNVPHRATDAYVRSMATLIRDQLEPGRRAYIEYSNEVWNGQFTQTSYAVNQGRAQGLNVEPSCSNNTGCRDTFAMLRFYSRRSRQIFEIFEDVFTTANIGRVERVMASQAVNSFFTDQILSFENASNKTDSFAIAPYFGDTINREFEPTRRDAYVAAGVNGVFNWLFGSQGAPDLGYGSLAQLSRVEFGGPRNIRETIRFQKEVADQHGVQLVAYEGGQHFLQGGTIFNSNNALTDPQINTLFNSVNRDARMKEAYLQYLSIWTQEGGGIFHHYVNSDSWSAFGRWGAKEFPTQPRTAAPKYDALMQFIADNPAQ